MLVLNRESDHNLHFRENDGLFFLQKKSSQYHNIISSEKVKDERRVCVPFLY